MKMRIVMIVFAAALAALVIALVRAPPTEPRVADDAVGDSSLAEAHRERTDEPPPARASAEDAGSAAAPATTSTVPNRFEELTLAELRAPCECANAWHRRRQQREVDMRNAETKDVFWSYETEQLLEQYIAAHPRATALNISSIDCRTSFCEIRGDSPPESVESFQVIIDEAAEQPWSTLEFRRAGGTYHRPDRSDLRALLSRTSVPEGAELPTLPPLNVEEECPCASDAWQDRLALLEHEARAREAKDVYWAYGMEQRLNTFIAAHPEVLVLESWTIDCRETFCEIRATPVSVPNPGSVASAANEEAYVLFGDILHEAIDDSDFGLGQRLETGMSITGGVVELDAIVTRRR